REVFEYIADENYVVKIESLSSSGDNWAEYRIWECVEHTKHKKWFAECLWISPSGLILIQKKTADFWKKHKKAPEKIPTYFTDVKTDNVGWIKNQLTFHDYSHCLEMFSSKGGLSNRMKKLVFHE